MVKTAADAPTPLIACNCNLKVFFIGIVLKYEAITYCLQLYFNLPQE